MQGISRTMTRVEVIGFSPCASDMRDANSMAIEKTNNALRKVEVECCTANKVLVTKGRLCLLFIVLALSNRIMRSAGRYIVTKTACATYTNIIYTG
jgi:hypothetical protein